MIKFLISKANKTRFQRLFKFFQNNHCEVCIFEEGLKYRNSCFEGIIYKEAFVEYPSNLIKKLKVMNIKEKKGLVAWFKKWKDLDTFTEIPVY